MCTCVCENFVEGRVREVSVEMCSTAKNRIMSSFMKVVVSTTPTVFFFFFMSR